VRGLCSSLLLFTILSMLSLSPDSFSNAGGDFATVSCRLSMTYDFFVFVIVRLGRVVRVVDRRGNPAQPATVHVQE